MKAAVTAQVVWAREDVAEVIATSPKTATSADISMSTCSVRFVEEAVGNKRGIKSSVIDNARL